MGRVQKAYKQCICTRDATFARARAFDFKQCMFTCICIHVGACADEQLQFESQAHLCNLYSLIIEVWDVCVIKARGTNANLFFIDQFYITS